MVTKSVNVPPNGKSVTVPFSYAPKRQGLHILTVVVREKGNEVLRAERPLSIGESEYVYFMRKPPEKQVGEQVLGRLIIDPPIPDWYEDVDLSWTTPHIAWGKPYFRGTLSVLFVSRNENSVAHWREIWERGDIAMDVSVVAYREGTKYPYTMPTQRKLMKKLATPSFDVMFFAGLNWEKGFTKPVARRIFSLIRQGKGAVILASPGALKKFLSDARKVDASEITFAYPFRHAKVWLYEKGKGRVAVIEGAPGYYESVNRSLGPDWLPNRWIPGWEYGYGLFVRAIYWAGRFESPIRIEKLQPLEENLLVKLVNRSEEPTRAVFELKVRNHLYEVEGSGETASTLPPGTSEVSIPITGELSDKMHIADLIIRDPQGRSVCWGSTTFEVARPVSVEASMDRESAGYREGEAVSAKVKLKRLSRRVETVQLFLTATDAYGRVAYKGFREVKLVQPELKLTFPLELRRVDILHDLDVWAKQYDRTLSRARITFYIFPERMHLYEDFYVACWGGLGADPLKFQATARKLREAGIDYTYSYASGKRSRDLAYRTHGFLLGPPGFCSLRRGYNRKRKYDRQKLTMEPPLVPRPYEIESFRKGASSMAKGYSEWGGADYHHIEDERTLSGEYDWSDYTLQAFRKWLKERYGTLDALNKQWDTNFKSWDEVIPARGEKIIQEKPDNLSQWLDFRIFCGWAINEYYVKLPAEAVKEGNPRAVVGMHGVYATSNEIPHDFSKFTLYTPVTGRYNGLEEEWYLSLSPGCIHGQYGGYGVERATPRHRFHPWRSLLHGGHWCFYYIMWNSGRYHQGILSPDQSVHGGYKDLARDEFSDLKGGIGKLFIETNFIHDSIAFPYSLSSLIGRSLDGRQHAGNLYTYKTLVQDLGFQHWTLAYDTIADDGLIKQKFKVLILPCTTFLSPREVTAIKKFVKGGGLLITDYHTAIRDEHGKKYEVPPLDVVFGIERADSKLDFTKGVLSFTDSAPESLRAERLEMTMAEPGLRLAGGKPWARFEDNTPALILNRYGRGRALYLNIHFGEYARSKGAGVAGEVIIEQKGSREFLEVSQAIFKEALALAGLKRRFTVLRDRKPLNDGETFYYARAGEDALYIATLFYCVRETTPVTLRLYRKAHLYDTRDRYYIGYTDRFSDVWQPGKVEVYSALPYRVVGIDVRFERGGADTPTFKQGEDLSFSARVLTDGRKPGLHILRLKLFRPDGSEAKAYTRNLKAERGEASPTIPLAYNETPGLWRLYLRDIATCVETAIPFTISDGRN